MYFGWVKAIFVPSTIPRRRKRLQREKANGGQDGDHNDDPTAVVYMEVELKSRRGDIIRITCCLGGGGFTL